MKNKKMMVTFCVLSLLVIIGVSILFFRSRHLPGAGLESAEVNAVSIAVSDARSFAIMENGDLWDWGRDWGPSKREPTKIIEDANAVFAGTSSTFTAITSDGALWVGGRRITGKRNEIFRYIEFLVVPFRAWQFTRAPEIIMNNVTFVAISGSGDWGNVMAITSDGRLWGWGSNNHGQLGIYSTKSDYSRPIRVKNDVVSVSVDRIGSTFAITSDGALWSWGNNSRGQLGNGTTENSRSPVRVMDNVVALSSGGSRAFAITSDGILWGWGSNQNGRLGDGVVRDRHSPVQIMENVTAVSASEFTAFAITSDSTLWSWGSNGSGQLGDGTTEDRFEPVRIMDDVVAVSAGNWHTLAITSDGELWAWGRNDFGQLGDGTTEDRRSPVRIMDGIRLP